MGRSAKSGFTLLESLLAFVMLAMVIGGAYTAIAQTISRQARLEADLEMARLARAILTEFTVTYPDMAKSGQLGSQYRWSIQENVLPVEEAAGLLLAPMQVTVQIVPTSGQPFRMATVLTRIAQ